MNKDMDFLELSFEDLPIQHNHELPNIYQDVNCVDLNTQFRFRKRLDMKNVNINNTLDTSHMNQQAILIN